MVDEAYRHAGSACPRCKRVLNASFDVRASARPPQPGDWTVCGHCAAALHFSDRLEVQLLTPADIMAATEQERRDLARAIGLVARVTELTGDHP